jgi:hypothetical protein
MIDIAEKKDLKDPSKKYGTRAVEKQAHIMKK